MRLVFALRPRAGGGDHCATSGRCVLARSVPPCSAALELRRRWWPAGGGWRASGRSRGVSRHLYAGRSAARCVRRQPFLGRLCKCGRSLLGRCGRASSVARDPRWMTASGRRYRHWSSVAAPAYPGWDARDLAVRRPPRPGMASGLDQAQRAGRIHAAVVVGTHGLHDRAVFGPAPERGRVEPLAVGALELGHIAAGDDRDARHVQ